MTPVARIGRGVILLYKSYSVGRMPRCRYIPTCSSYAIEAIEVHGARRGLRLAVHRLARCHPWGKWGVDLVPPATNPSR